MKTFVLLAALLPAAFASPVQDIKPRDPKADCTTTTTPAPAPKPTPNFCSTIDWLISANHGSSYAASFCSSFLHVTTVTSTVLASTTVVGSSVTVTNTLTSSVTPTVTSTVTAVVTSTTSSLSYITSTCTPYSSTTTASAAASSGASIQKRTGSYPNNWNWNWNWPYPTSKYQPSDISSACSCLVTTPTAFVTRTSTISKAGPTTTVSVTTTVFPTTSTVLTSVTSTTTSTKVITSTEIEPSNPTGTFTTNDKVTTFEEYSGIDFFAGDLQPYSPCSCDLNKSGGNCTIGGYNYGLCTGFDSCQTICGAINEQTGNLTCVAVTYTGSDDSGECYPKSSLNACGTVADDRRSGLVSLEGYKYAS